MEKYHELLPGGKVLEVGSGAGKEAAALIGMGYEYTGADASKGLIALAQQRNPTAAFKNVAVEELDFPGGILRWVLDSRNSASYPEGKTR